MTLTEFNLIQKVSDFTHRDGVEVGDRLVEDLGCDSLDTIEIVMALEELTDKECPDDVIDGINTVQDLIDVFCDFDANPS